jgi:vanillate O-demethylase monooxygenase subunit
MHAEPSRPDRKLDGRARFSHDRSSRRGRLDDEGLDSWTAHVMTPDAEQSTHHFFCHTSDNVSRDPQIVPMVKGILLSAFQDEDAPMIEAQQRNTGERDFWDFGPVLLSTDSGAVRARRVLEKLIAAERGPAAT